MLKKMNFEDDYKVALSLQRKFDEEANRRKRDADSNTRITNKIKSLESQEKMSLIDKSLEYLDPNPDINALFLHFNDVFFWRKLMAVEVKWSPRMTSCAGVCCYEGRGRLCSIRLSLPLLKLRPRKDLVETLLHEMIHAFLFVTNNDRDRDGHGPEFHKHMDRINHSAGTKISVYHNFHDEVRSYQQHWWKCQGPCRNRRPYFGMVRRAMNRAPGPSDFWWSDHQSSCGGVFVKIREPEGYSAGKKRGKGGGVLSQDKGKIASPKNGLQNQVKNKKSVDHKSNESNKKSSSKSDILGYFSSSKTEGIPGNSSMVSQSGGKKSLFGSLGSTIKNKATSENTEGNANKTLVPFSGRGQVLGGSSNSSQAMKARAGGGVSVNRGDTFKRRDTSVIEIDLDACTPPPSKQPRPSPTSGLCYGASSSKSGSEARRSSSVLLDDYKQQLVDCPVCKSPQVAATINKHLDECIVGDDAAAVVGGVSNNKCPTSSMCSSSSGTNSWLLECPGCRNKVEESAFDDHLNECKHISGLMPCAGESFDRPTDDVIVIDDLECACPACGSFITRPDLDTHLDGCLSSMSFEENWE